MERRRRRKVEKEEREGKMEGARTTERQRKNPDWDFSADVEAQCSTELGV